MAMIKNPLCTTLYQSGINYLLWKLLVFILFILAADIRQLGGRREGPGWAAGRSRSAVLGFFSNPEGFGVAYWCANSP